MSHLLPSSTQVHCPGFDTKEEAVGTTGIKPVLVGDQPTSSSAMRVPMATSRSFMAPLSPLTGARVSDWSDTDRYWLPSGSGALPSVFSCLSRVGIHSTSGITLPLNTAVSRCRPASKVASRHVHLLGSTPWVPRLTQVHHQPGMATCLSMAIMNVVWVITTPHHRMTGKARASEPELG